MHKDLQIVIPSRSRHLSLRTINNISINLWNLITVVVPYGQFTAYRNSLRQPINVVPFEETTGVGPKRDFILRMNYSGKVIMLDDDLKFYKRIYHGTKFEPSSSSDTEHMVYEIVKYLDDYPMVGLTDKFMSQTKPRVMMESQRFNQVLGINRDLLPMPWPQFRLAHDEEHDFHLQLLTKGYKTAVLTEWSKSDTPNAAGGCRDWRDTESMAQTHKELQELWPGLVTIAQDPPRARYNWSEAKRRGALHSQIEQGKIT